MPFPTTRDELLAAGYSFHVDKICKCGARIEMFRTPNKKVIPIHFTRDVSTNREVCVAHFADCPNVEEFRRPK